MKRFISANTSDILSMDAKDLKQSIKASEGRVIVSENVATRETVIGDITNAEIAASVGTDMILLNGVDVLKPEIAALDKTDNFVQELHRLVGLPIGVNLEPIDPDAEMLEGRLEISSGRQANLETIEEIERLGMDFVCFTGNPGTGVTNDAIKKSIELAKEHFSGLVIAGKMHGAGVDGPVIDEESVEAFITAGADIILTPSVGTVPGFDSENLKAVVQKAHKSDRLVLTAIGTSQEGSDPDTIKQMAIQNKICGADMQHIGDAGYGGLAPVDNIYAMSKAIRGERHTISRMARSINR